MAAVADSDLYFDILALALFESAIRYLGHARALLERNLEPHLLSFDLFSLDFDVREKALFPKTLDGLGDLVARNLDFVAHRKAREADENEIFVAIGTHHFDSCDFVGLSLVGIFDVGSEFLRGCFGILGLRSGVGCQRGGDTINGHSLRHGHRTAEQQ